MEKKASPAYYSAVVVINTNGEVLLGKRTEDGIWTTPAGGSEPEETDPAKTAVRELFEEAGIPTDPRFLQPIMSRGTKNGKICHVYLYVANTNITVTSNMDPDQEVKTWKWFSMDSIPSALRDDMRRWDSVMAGYMKFHGITKSLIETLEKGGKPATIGETRLFGGKEFKKMGNGEWVPVVHQEEKQLEAIDSKKEKTPKQKLVDKLDEKTMITHAEQHLSDLKHGAILKDVQTRSGKPVFTSVDSALSSGYTPEDFREVGNVYYDRAERMGKIVERMEGTGQKPEKSLQDIAKLNLKMAKMFINQANHLEDRKVKTAMNKSIIHTGYNDASEINTASFATELTNAKNEGYWLEYMHNTMDGYEYGDIPREIALDTGTLYLVKVDDGIYTGIFKTIDPVDNGELIDNAKVRLERMTLPSIVQFCLSKEWIKLQSEEPVEVPVTEMALADKLEAPPMPQGSTVEQRIMILQLLDKLMS